MKASSMTVWRPRWHLVFLTLLIGYLLTICPMPGRTIWLRPLWIMMILAYWIVMFPTRFGLGTVWTTGVFLDLFNGSLLGEHALALTVALYILLRIRTRFRFFPILQQSLGIFGMVSVYQLIIFCIQEFVGQPPLDSWYWLASITSMLLWPWVFSMLHYCQCRFSTT